MLLWWMVHSWLKTRGVEQKKWLAGSPSRPTKRSSRFEMKRLLLHFGGLHASLSPARG
jgi:hypothetical protein